jgi:hypothetical protein
MESQEYFVEQLKGKIFKCGPKNRPKNAQFLSIIASNFKPIMVTSVKMLSQYGH